MIANLHFIAAPLVASLIILSITSYFGIHVLKREIIFIDITLAQIAVLGGVVSMFLEPLFHERDFMIGSVHFPNILSYSSSLVFCLGAAVIFTFLKHPRINIPIEAFIGIGYAFATMATIIILDKGAGSDVHLHDMLTGTLSWTSWPQVARLAVVIAVIGGFHIVFRRRFIQLSEFYQAASGPFKHQKMWDFLFYFTFGIMIVEAVNVAGVLTVFAFLIFPASISALFSTHWNKRIAIGMISGLCAALVGLYLSVSLDVTSSPLIIVLLGIILLGGLLVVKIIPRRISGG
jgi:zinc/manganese transport system permease protein